MTRGERAIKLMLCATRWTGTTLPRATYFCLAFILLAPTLALAAGPYGSIEVGNWKGGAYTNDATGQFSHCAAHTQYQSGIEAHLDWAISPYVGDKLHIGAVGYVFNQLTGDSGAGARLGDFRSRVAGIGPQIGFFFPLADRQGYLNLRGYYEFDARNRLAGWTTFVTFSIEAPEQKSPKLIRKQ